MATRGGVDRAMDLILDKKAQNILDYQFVMDCLRSYHAPRAKASLLVKSGALIRLKKGLYLLGEHFKRAPYCHELIANLLYLPSYVSLEKALHTYGLIPEHVEMVTSVTFKPRTEFTTPIGLFTYDHVPLSSYPTGITMKKSAAGENFLIATPEKALTDMLTIRRGKVTSLLQMEQILLEDLRIEESDLTRLDLKQIRAIHTAHPHSATLFLDKWLTRKRPYG